MIVKETSNYFGLFEMTRDMSKGTRRSLDSRAPWQNHMASTVFEVVSPTNAVVLKRVWLGDGDFHVDQENLQGEDINQASLSTKRNILGVKRNFSYQTEYTGKITGKGLQTGEVSTLDGIRQVGAMRTKLLQDIEDPASGFSQEDQRIASTLANTLFRRSPKNLKYRGSAEGFLRATPNDLHLKEKIGIVLFAGLVGEVDDIIDQPEFHQRYVSPEALSDAIRGSTVTLKTTQEGITIGEIEDFVTSLFTNDKQEILANFFKDATREEWEIREEPMVPGHYSYEDALKYRSATSEAYSKTARLLAGLTEAEITQTVGRPGMVAQYLDDFSDAVVDGINNLPNLFVGYAYSHSQAYSEEWQYLEKRIQQQKKGSLRNSLLIRRHMPNISQGYASEMQTLMANMQDSGRKKVFQRFTKWLGVTV